LPDLRGEALLRDIHDLGIVHVTEVRVSDIYSLEGDLSAEELTGICLELVVDPVIQEYFCYA